MSDQFEQSQFRFPSSGLDLNHTVDSVTPGKLPFAKNVRRHQDGSLAPRIGVTSIGTPVTSQTPVHSIRQLSDAIWASATYIIGTGTYLAYGTSTFTDKDSGYSGDPLTMVPLRPIQSPHPWMYIADRSRMRKLQQDGTLHSIGLAPPTVPPTLTLGAPKHLMLADGETTSSPKAVTVGGNAGAAALLNYRITTTITALWYDVGSTGWVSIQPAAMDATFRPGMHLNLAPGAGNAETVLIQSVHKAISATTVARLIFDSGSAGTCSIVFTTPIADLVIDSHVSLAQASGNTVVARVRAVIPGPAGTGSIRLDTGATTLNVSSSGIPSTAITVTGVNTLRCYAVQTHAAAETIRANGVRSTLTYATGAESGHMTITPDAVIDGSILEAGIPITEDDDVHLSLRVADLSAVTEGRIMLDVDRATNDFTRNYYMLAFRPDELSIALDGTATVHAATLEKVANESLTEVATTPTEQGVGSVPWDPKGPPFEEPITGPYAIGVGRGVPIGEGGIRERGGSGSSGGAFPSRGIRTSAPPVTGGTAAWASPAERALVNRQGISVEGRRYLGGRAAAAMGNYQSWVVDNGDSQWIELRFKIKDMTRIGTDDSRNLSTIVKIRLFFITSATTTVDWSSIWIGGGYGLDTGGLGSPYHYRYRARCLSTGVRSNYSPVSREGISPRRSTVNLTLTQYTTSTEANVLDVERYGGSILGWHYVGSIANAATPTMIDALPDSSIVYNSSEGNTNFQLWPVVGVPQSGSLLGVSGSTIACIAAATVSNATNAAPIVITTAAAHSFIEGQYITIASVTGNTAANGNWTITYIDATSFSLNGSTGNGTYGSGGTATPLQFNTAWAPGVTIRVGNIPYTIYRVRSATLLELVENAGSQGNVVWNVDEPTLLGQPLAILFGPYLGFTFGLGDPYNPGTLYVTKGNDPDATTETHRIEMTAPSEPLMNGCIYNGRPYVFSSDRMFEAFPAFDTPNVFDFREVPNGKGLFSRWAMAVGPKIWFLGKDGIYETMGEGPTSITGPSLDPLFPRDGNIGETVNTIVAPNIVSAQAVNLRLAYYDDHLYFDYIDTGSAYRTLELDLKTGGWWFHDFTPDVACHYGAEGSGAHLLLIGGRDATSGKLYSNTGVDDAGTTIACQIRTPSHDIGNARDEKLFGDYLVDANTNDIAVTITPGYNNHGSTLTTATLDHVGRLQSSFNLASGVGQEARNFSLDFTWNSSDGAQRFYLYALSHILRPSDLKLRGTEWDAGDYLGAKWLQGIVIEADTDNSSRTVTVKYDNASTAATLTVQHNGRIVKPYSWAGVFCHTMQLLPTDANSWKLYNVRWVFEPAPELTTTWETPDTTHGLLGYQHLRDGYIAHVSSANITLTVTIDGTDYTYTIAHGTSVYTKTYVIFQPVKGKTFQYKLTSSAGFRLYAQDSEVRVKPWGNSEGYNVIRPFGGDSMVKGAVI